VREEAASEQRPVVSEVERGEGELVGETVGVGVMWVA